MAAVFKRLHEGHAGGKESAPASLPKRTIRVGFTGAPGVGKSSFIETFVGFLVAGRVRQLGSGRRAAILVRAADLARMELARQEQKFASLPTLTA